MKSITPYVGVTGYTSASQVEHSLKFVPEDSVRKLMVGVLVSSKTLEGLTNSYKHRYPPIGTVKDIFLDDPRCLNLIHYNTKDAPNLVSQVLKLAELAGDNCHGFQFNIRWPDIDHLAEIRHQLPNHQIVVQIGSGALRAFVNENDPLGPMLMREKLSQYADRGVIDYMLFDPSGGTGRPFNPDTAVRMLQPYQGQELAYGLGVAGGLSAATIDLLLPVVAEFPRVSWDAEGRLRDADDMLCLDSTALFIQRSFLIEQVLMAKFNFPGAHVDYDEGNLFDMYSQVQRMLDNFGYPRELAFDMLSIVFGRRFVNDNRQPLSLGLASSGFPEQG